MRYVEAVLRILAYFKRCIIAPASILPESIKKTFSSIEYTLLIYFLMYRTLCIVLLMKIMLVTKGTELGCDLNPKCYICGPKTSLYNTGWDLGGI